MQESYRGSGADPTGRLWAKALGRPTPSSTEVAVDLTTAILSIRDDQPVVLVHPATSPDEADRLPTGCFQPHDDTSLDMAVRERVRATTDLDLGFVEQLSTDFAVAPNGGEQIHVPRLSIGYLALTRVESHSLAHGAQWADVYQYLPWEDFRQGRPPLLGFLMPRLSQGAQDADETAANRRHLTRSDRLQIAFGPDETWDDERVAERAEIVVEAGLAQVEGLAARWPHRSLPHPSLPHPWPPKPSAPVACSNLPRRLFADAHLLILAAALGRLRARLRHRPVVFELLALEFTLFELQKTVEGILGPNLHKQNFRRLVEATRLVEPTGEIRTHTGGRPAKLFRFRQSALLERPSPGLRVRLGRAI